MVRACDAGCRITRWVLPALMALAVAGCGGGRGWRMTNITGLMPVLKFTLTDAATGASMDAAHFKGKVVLLYFGYTHCPDVCPMTLADLAAAVRTLGARADQVRILFVSVDPARDTIPVLKRYAEAFGPQVVGLRGDQEQLRRLTKRYRVTYGYEKPDVHGNYVVSHSSAVYVFDRNGHVRLLAQHPNRTADLAHDLKALLAEG